MNIEIEKFLLEELNMQVSSGKPKPVAVDARILTGTDVVQADISDALLEFVTQRGAVLLRGFPEITPVYVRDLFQKIRGKTETLKSGEHPTLPELDGLQSPVRFSEGETLLWHHENTFNKIWPRYIAFFCAIPATQGGETTIVDGRVVYSQASSRFKSELNDKGIIYTRNCDGIAGRSWQQIYGTLDKVEAKRKAEQNDERLVFKESSATIVTKRSAFITVEGDHTWFNQLLHWHIRMLPVAIIEAIQAGLLEAPRSCSFGDGTHIADKDVSEIMNIHREVEFPVSWRQGDLLILDNRMFSHGRSPYIGPRKHFVSTFFPDTALRTVTENVVLDTSRA